MIERDLVVRAQGGDVEAFPALTSARARQLFSVARMIVRDDEAAADALQDALLARLARPGCSATRSGSTHGCGGSSSGRATGPRGGGARAASSRLPSSPTGSRPPDPAAWTTPRRRGCSATSSSARSAGCRPTSAPVVVLHFYLGFTLAESPTRSGSPWARCVRASTGRSAAMRAAVEADERSPIARHGDRRMTASSDPFEQTLADWLGSLEGDEPNGLRRASSRTRRRGPATGLGSPGQTSPSTLAPRPARRPASASPSSSSERCSPSIAIGLLVGSRVDPTYRPLRSRRSAPVPARP